jgi:hypothetical protein
MAIVRCGEHGVGGKGIRNWKLDYVLSVPPVGGEITAAVCGVPVCERPGRIWLTRPEVAQYEAGRRVFMLMPNRAKVRAEDVPVIEREPEGGGAWQAIA